MNYGLTSSLWSKGATFSDQSSFVGIQFVLHLSKQRCRTCTKFRLIFCSISIGSQPGHCRSGPQIVFSVEARRSNTESWNDPENEWLHKDNFGPPRGYPSPTFYQCPVSLRLTGVTQIFVHSPSHVPQRTLVHCLELLLQKN